MKVKEAWKRFVANKFLVIAFTAGISAYIGAEMRTFVDRPRLSLEVSSCRLGSGEDLQTITVDIPPDLADKLKRSEWLPSLSGRVTGETLQRAIDALNRGAREAPGALQFLEKSIGHLDDIGKQGDSAKHEFLDRMSDYGIITGAIEGAAACGELRCLPQLADLSELVPVAGVFPNPDTEGGFFVRLKRARFLVSFGGGLYDEDLERLANAYAYFDAKSIEEALKAARTSIIDFAAEAHVLENEMRALLTANSYILVDVAVSNRGQTPALFTKWGALFIHSPSGGDAVPIELGLAARGGRGDEEGRQAPDEGPGFDVKGRDARRVTFRSEQSIGKIRETVPSIEAILSLGAFDCQVGVRRSDASRTEAEWVVSATGRFGKDVEKCPEDEIRELARSL